MTLLDDLRAIEDFTPSAAPVANEILEIVGKLFVYIEHGDALLKAADQDKLARQAGKPAYSVNDLIAPPSPEELAARNPAPAAPDARDAEIAQLQAQVQSLLAQEQRTTATVEPAADAPATTSPAPGHDAPAPDAGSPS